MRSQLAVHRCSQNGTQLTGGVWPAFLVQAAYKEKKITSKRNIFKDLHLRSSYIRNLHFPFTLNDVIAKLKSFYLRAESIDLYLISAKMKLHLHV